MNRRIFTAIGLLLAWLAWTVAGRAETGPVHVLSTGGDVEFSMDGWDWHTPGPGDVLHEGAILRTGRDGFIDFLIQQSGASLRLPPESELHLDRISSVPAGEMRISTTRLTLPKGMLIGSQSRLPALSTFEVATTTGTATFDATEYVVRADGAVSAIAGSVTVRYKARGAGGPVRVTVDPGQSFDPATGEVVETTPEYLENLIAEVETTVRNAESFRVPDAIVVVQPDPFVSPTKGH